MTLVRRHCHQWSRYPRQNWSRNRGSLVGCRSLYDKCWITLEKITVCKSKFSELTCLTFLFNSDFFWNKQSYQNDIRRELRLNRVYVSLFTWNASGYWSFSLEQWKMRLLYLFLFVKSDECDYSSQVQLECSRHDMRVIFFTPDTSGSFFKIILLHQWLLIRSVSWGIFKWKKETTCCLCSPRGNR